MNLVVFILFILFGIHTCAVFKPTPSSSSSSLNLDLASDVDRDHGRSVPLDTEKRDNEKLVDDHAGDHDRDDKTTSSGSKARKGVTYLQQDELEEKDIDDGNKAASTIVHTNTSISNDRASTTITKSSEIATNKTSESVTTKSKSTLTSDRSSSSYASDKYSPSDSKSTKTDTSSSNVSNVSSSIYSKSSTSTSASTESTTSSKSSFNKKPTVTYSVEDDPMLLNIPRTRQTITPLTTYEEKLESPANLPSSDFVLDVDRMQSKREMYIFPLVVLIFLVPMVLGVGIIILRRVRDYWSTRHYRRMDFLVDGMYNT